MTNADDVLDVVFIVEATAAMGPYFQEVRSAYIEPTLEKFCGGPPEDVDYGFDYSCTLYNLVTFFSSDVHPAPTFQTIAPTSSTFELLKWMEQINFIGGCGEAKGHIADGLGAALQLFDDLATFRENSVKTKKFCILVCNSPPYDLPCQSALRYLDYTAEALCSMMGERNINFCVLSPRKIPALLRLFNRAGWDQSVPFRDFTRDPRHLVLLKGYHLQERPPSPMTDRKDIDKSNLINKVGSPANAVLSSPKPGSQGLNKIVNSPAATSCTDGQFKVPTCTITTQSVNPGGITSVRPGMPMSGMQQGLRQVGPRQPVPVIPGVRLIQSSSGAQEVAKLILEEATKSTPMIQTTSPNPGMVINAQRQTRPNLTTMSSQGQMMGQTNPGMMTSQAQQLMINQQRISGQMAQANLKQNPRMQQIGQQLMNQQQMQQQLNQGQVVQQQMNQGQMAQQQQQNVQPKRDFKMIWRGVLEWQDKKQATNPPVRQTKSLQCEVFAMSTGENDIDTSRWRANLVMQLIPQQLLSQLQMLIKQSRNVEFKFAQNDRETLMNLQRVMSSGFAGCVHFPMQSQCDIRVLLLLYSGKKDQFIGMIPNDQAQFVEGIRAVITNHKQAQQQKQQMLAQQQQQQMRQQQPQMSQQQPQLSQQQPQLSQQQPQLSQQQPQMSQQQPQLSQQQQQINQPVIAQGNQAVSQQQQSQGGPDSESERRNNLQKMRSLEQEMEALKQKELQFQADQKTLQIKALESARQQQQQQQQLLQLQQQQQRLLDQQQPQQSQQQRLLDQQQQPQQSQQPQIPGQNQQLRHLLMNQQQQQQQNQFRQQQFMMQQQQRQRAAGQQIIGQPISTQQIVGQMQGNVQQMQLPQGQQFMQQDEFGLDMLQ